MWAPAKGGESMNLYVGQIQDRAKSTFTALVAFVLKFFSGALIGLTIGLIFQEIVGFGMLVLSLFVCASVVTFLKIVWNWKISAVLILDLFCVLVGLLLRTYIMLAPG